MHHETTIITYKGFEPTHHKIINITHILYSQLYRVKKIKDIGSNEIPNQGFEHTLKFLSQVNC